MAGDYQKRHQGFFISEITDAELGNLLKEALKERRSEFKNCRYCKKSFPPEHGHSEDVRMDAQRSI